MRKLKILRLLLSLGETSGPYNLLTLPLEEKQEITICTYFESPVSVTQGIRLIEGDNSLAGFFRGLKNALLQNRYDIIHAHTPHVALLYLLFTLVKAGKPRIPKVLTLHCSYDNLKLRNRFILIPVLRFFERIVFCSESSFQSFPAVFLRLAAGKARIVKNGVDIDRIDRCKENKQSLLSNKGFKIATVGRLIEAKNFTVLLRAFREIHDNRSSLAFIGEGPIYNDLIRKIGNMGLEGHVKLTGLIPREHVFKYLIEADLYVSASVREGLPVAVLEAMACSCPVILSDIPPHREIADGVDFIPLVDSNDVNGYVEAIKKFICMSYSERIEIGEKCRRLVEDKFPLDLMHRGYSKIYREVITS